MQYDFLNEVGRGKFGVVWRARNKTTQEIVAIKKIKKNEHDWQLLQRLLQREVTVMKTLDHPNIVHLQEHFFSHRNLTFYLVMEFCHGGDLNEYLIARKKLDIEVIRRIMIQLSSALEELRRKNLIHRDLKPHNLLLSSLEGEPVEIKIADFGLSRYLEPDLMAQSTCGSCVYMAPEVAGGREYDGRADLWSVGIILHQMVTGTTNYEISEEAGYVNWDPLCLDLCRRLLQRDPNKRILFEEFFNHGFLKPPGSTKEEPANRFTQAKTLLRKYSTLSRCSSSGTLSKSASKPPLPRPVKHEDDHEEISKEYVLVNSPMEVYTLYNLPKQQQDQPSSSHDHSKSQKQEVKPSKQEEDSLVPAEERLRNLIGCARLLQEVARFKLEDGKHLESLSVQVMAMAALNQASSVSSSSNRVMKEKAAASEFTKVIASQIGESCVEILSGASVTQVASEIIYQAALSAGRSGAAEEVMDRFRIASIKYAKAQTLFFFLIMEDSPAKLQPRQIALVRKYFDAVAVRYDACLKAARCSSG